MRRILVFSDDTGFPQLLKSLPVELVCGLVGAEIRPHQHSQMRQLARNYGLPILIQPRVSAPTYTTFVNQVRELKPDLILVSSYSMLVRTDIIAVSPFGGINIHGALLPQYRGANPIQWALMNNESETGVTMHYMTADFDSGDIIAQRRVPIYFDDTWRDVQTRIGEAAEKMLADEIPKFLSQTNAREPQDESKACYYKRRTSSDGLIDWQRSVLFIYNLIRALVKPHPGAFYCNGAAKVVLDEYLAIPQVTALKYGQEGTQTLRSSKMLLSPLDQSHFSILAEQNFINWPLFHSPLAQHSHRQIAAAFKLTQDRNDTVIFTIRRIQNDELIGFCQLCEINYVRRDCKLQYIFLNNVTTPNHDENLEVAHILLDFAFTDLSLARVYIHIVSTDEASIRHYERAGFTQDGLSDHSVYVDGGLVDVVTISISRNSYAASERNNYL